MLRRNEALSDPLVGQPPVAVGAPVGSTAELGERSGVSFGVGPPVDGEVLHEKEMRPPSPRSPEPTRSPLT